MAVVVVESQAAGQSQAVTVAISKKTTADLSLVAAVNRADGMDDVSGG